MSASACPVESRSTDGWGEARFLPGSTALPGHGRRPALETGVEHETSQTTGVVLSCFDAGTLPTFIFGKVAQKVVACRVTQMSRQNFGGFDGHACTDAGGGKKSGCCVAEKDHPLVCPSGASPVEQWPIVLFVVVDDSLQCVFGPCCHGCQTVTNHVHERCGSGCGVVAMSAEDDAQTILDRVGAQKESASPQLLSQILLVGRVTPGDPSSPAGVVTADGVVADDKISGGRSHAVGGHDQVERGGGVSGRVT